jgi:hypothetical protein
MHYRKEVLDLKTLMKSFNFHMPVFGVNSLRI